MDYELMIQRDEFFSAISDLKTTQREIRDLLQQQNGKVNTTVTDVAVLKEQVGTLSGRIKDSTARWLAIVSLITGGMIEVIRYMTTHVKIP